MGEGGGCSVLLVAKVLTVALIQYIQYYAHMINKYTYFSSYLLTFLKILVNGQPVSLCIHNILLRLSLI